MGEGTPFPVFLASSLRAAGACGFSDFVPTSTVGMDEQASARIVKETLLIDVPKKPRPLEKVSTARWYFSKGLINVFVTLQFGLVSLWVLHTFPLLL